jgi:hypothetical protein
MPGILSGRILVGRAVAIAPGFAMLRSSVRQKYPRSALSCPTARATRSVGSRCRAADHHDQPQLFWSAA